MKSLVAVASLVGVVFLATVVATVHTPSSPRSAGATDLAPTGNVPLPAPPAVLAFRGGGGAWNGTHWGGVSRFDGSCEGAIRQTLGLLNVRGAPVAVPAARQITVGGAVVGFTNAAGTYRAYNIDASTFSVAFAALNAGDSLYSCGHGALADNGNKGGVILLDGAAKFDGFCSGGFPTGTNATAANPPYPSAAACLLAPAGPVNVHLHHCVSAADPDGAAAVMASVSATLAGIPNVTIAHAHATLAKQGVRISFDNGPAPGAPSAAQINAAVAAVSPPFRLTAIAFPGQYAAGQAAIDGAVPPAGTVALHLTYGDKGTAPDPPLEEEDTGCPTTCCAVGGIAERVVGGSEAPTAPANGSESSGAWYTAIATSVTVAAAALAAAGWYARRRWLP